MGQEQEQPDHDGHNGKKQREGRRPREVEGDHDQVDRQHSQKNPTDNFRSFPGGLLGGKHEDSGHKGHYKARVEEDDFRMRDEENTLAGVGRDFVRHGVLRSGLVVAAL